jgi:itaconate CoA-transferase
MGTTPASESPGPGPLAGPPGPLPEPVPGPLAGIRVVALEQAVAAPLCSRHLADLGAEVIKIERPYGGDFARGYDSVVHGESAYFVWLNHGKRSLSLDIASESGRRVLEALLDTADVFLHNLGPGAIDRLGFDAGRIRSRWPGLISCAVSGFGADGPFREHKAFDLLLQAESGLLAVTGTRESAARVGISIADICAAMYALAAILAALVERDRTGVGKQLGIAMLDGLAEWMAVPGLFERYTGAPPARLGLHHPSIAPYGAYATGDGGSVVVAVQNDGQWRRFCELVLERLDLVEDHRFATNERRVANRIALDEEIQRVFTRIARPEAVARLDAADVPSGSLNSVRQLLDHPQLEARGRWREVSTPTGPATIPRSPLGDGGGSVPAPGDDTAAILDGLGLGLAP